MTAIYYTICEKLPSHTFEKAASLLPMEMQQKIRKYIRWQDAHAYLYGKLLLKAAISELGYNYPLESIKTTKYGKPYFKENDFGFNISHSGEYIVCVVSTEEKYNLGVDIEEVKPIQVDDFKSIFSDEEKSKMNNYSKFYTFWTRKEAVVKADGRGLQIPLKTINTTNLSVILEDQKYNLYKVDIDENYMIHIATSTKFRENVKYFQVTKDRLLNKLCVSTQ